MNHERGSRLEVMMETEIEKAVYLLPFFGDPDEGDETADGTGGQPRCFHEALFAGAVRKGVAVGTGPGAFELFIEMFR
ncbi:MAG: hypothetical protein U9R36_00305, partial [Elusimicrobiota bacterium]|nr:hypothetical protein [Elusimicrobiota bacterium]